MGDTIPDYFPCEFFFCNSVFMLEKSGGGKWRRIDDMSHCHNPKYPYWFAPNYFSLKENFPVRFAQIKDAVNNIIAFPGRI